MNRCSFAIFFAALLALFAFSPVSSAQGARPAMYGTSPWRPLPDWDYDGMRILGHIGQVIYLWSAKDGRVLNTFSGHRETIHWLQFSPNGRYALSSSWIVGADYPVESKDTSVRLWDLKSGNQVWRLDGQVRGTFSPDGKRLLTYSIADSNDALAVAMWDVESGRKQFVAKVIGGDAYYSNLAFSPDGKRFAYLQYTLRVYDSKDGHEVWSRDAIDSFHFYGVSGDVGAFGGDKVTIMTSSGPVTKQIDAPTSGFWSTKSSWTPDGHYIIASGWEDPRLTKCGIRIWNVDSRELILDAPCGANASVPLVSPDAEHFLIQTMVSDKPVGLWQLCSIHSAKQCINVVGMGEINDAQSAGGVIGFAPDGKTFLTGGRSFSVRSSESGLALHSFDLLGPQGFAQ